MSLPARAGERPLKLLIEYRTQEDHELGVATQRHSRAIPEDAEGLWKFRRPGKQARAQTQTMDDFLPGCRELCKSDNRSLWDRRRDQFISDVCKAWKPPEWEGKSKTARPGQQPESPARGLQGHGLGAGVIAGVLGEED